VEQQYVIVQEYEDPESTHPTVQGIAIGLTSGQVAQLLDKRPVDLYQGYTIGALEWLEQEGYTVLRVGVVTAHYYDEAVIDN